MKMFSFIVPSSIYLTTTLNVSLMLLKREALGLAKQNEPTLAAGVSKDISDGNTVLSFDRLFLL
jgi:hypothetical protein